MNGFRILKRSDFDILCVMLLYFYSGINHQKGFIFALYRKA